MLLQRSLFPDAFEVQEQALAALDELDLDEALRRVEEAGDRDPGLGNLGALNACIRWLRRELGSGPVSDDELAALFSIVPEACRSGELERAAADLVDQVIARQGLRRAGSSRAFLDGEERVHRGALLLVLGRAGEALPLLRESLAAGRDQRADLWGYLGDACLALERGEEANEGFVRALLLSAREADLHRLRHPRLAELRDELLGTLPEAQARELLLVHAWLDGTLAIPPENGWLDRHLSRLHLAAAVRAGPPPEQRFRRFTLLFYLDRSRRPGEYEKIEREEMQALCSELFERVLGRIRTLEHRQTAPLRW